MYLHFLMVIIFSSGLEPLLVHLIRYNDTCRTFDAAFSQYWFIRNFNFILRCTPVWCSSWLWNSHTAIPTGLRLWGSSLAAFIPTSIWMEIFVWIYSATSGALSMMCALSFSPFSLCSVVSLFFYFFCHFYEDFYIYGMNWFFAVFFLQRNEK